MASRHGTGGGSQRFSGGAAAGMEVVEIAEVV
jgi:hypothetical protein